MMKLLASLLLLMVFARLNAAQTTTTPPTDEVLEEIANGLCYRLALSQSSLKSPGTVFKEVIGKYLELQLNDENIRVKVITFWNQHSQKLICTNKSNDYTYPQHVVNRVIDMKIQENTFFDFLLETDDGDSELKADMNIVHINNEGKRETVLDYVERILADKSNKIKYNFDVLYDFKDSLIEEYNAKRASELP